MICKVGKKGLYERHFFVQPIPPARIELDGIRLWRGAPGVLIHTGNKKLHKNIDDFVLSCKSAEKIDVNNVYFYQLFSEIYTGIHSRRITDFMMEAETGYK